MTVKCPTRFTLDFRPLFRQEGASSTDNEGGMMRRRGVGALALGVLIATHGVAIAASMESRLQALEELVRQQQSEIEQLRGELKQQKAIGTATQQQAERAEEQSKAVEKKATASIPDWVNKFTPFGDIRIRQEGFYNQPTKAGTKTVARNRTRLRWRLGMKYAYSDELSATVRIASGNPDDPISTNETLDGSFSRKHVNLDWAYLTVAPGKSFGIRPGLLTLNAGKFPNPMFRVGEMVFDDDLSPEGFNETVQLLSEPCGPFDQVKIHAQQWTFKEVSNGQDGWMFGGQINPTSHIGDVQLEGGLAQYWWRNPDLIAQQANTNSTLKGSISQNRLITDGDSMITGFESGFNQSNLTLAGTIPNVAGSMPLKVFGDYVYNWDAAHGSEANGAMGGVRLGNPKEAGDWAGTAYYEYLERDATIGAFSFSDFGPGGTNQQGPVLQLDYQLFKPLTLRATGYLTKFIEAPVDVNNRMQVRLQLDAMLRF
jgi:Putative porin